MRGLATVKSKACNLQNQSMSQEQDKTLFQTVTPRIEWVQHSGLTLYYAYGGTCSTHVFLCSIGNNPAIFTVYTFLSITQAANSCVSNWKAIQLQLANDSSVPTTTA